MKSRIVSKILFYVAFFINHSYSTDLSAVEYFKKINSEIHLIRNDADDVTIVITDSDASSDSIISAMVLSYHKYLEWNHEQKTNRKSSPPSFTSRSMILNLDSSTDDIKRFIPVMNKEERHFEQSRGKYQIYKEQLGIDIEKSIISIEHVKHRQWFYQSKFILIGHQRPQLLKIPKENIVFVVDNNEPAALLDHSKYLIRNDANTISALILSKIMNERQYGDETLVHLLQAIIIEDNENDFDTESIDHNVVQSVETRGHFYNTMVEIRQNRRELMNVRTVWNRAHTKCITIALSYWQTTQDLVQHRNSANSAFKQISGKCDTVAIVGFVQNARNSFSNRATATHGPNNFNIDILLIIDKMKFNKLEKIIDPIKYDFEEFFKSFLIQHNSHLSSNLLNTHQSLENEIISQELSFDDFVGYHYSLDITKPIKWKSFKNNFDKMLLGLYIKDFLKQINRNHSGILQIVYCNDDIDSIVTGIVFAYHYNKFPKYSGNIIPVIDMNRSDLTKRRDLRFLFEVNNIKEKYLIFSDDHLTTSNQDLKYILIKPSEAKYDYKKLLPNVVEIIDNKKHNYGWNHDDKRIMFNEYYATTSSYLTEQMLSVDVDYDEIHFLYQAILLETLLFDNHQLEKHDREILNIIEDRLSIKSESRKQFIADALDAQYNVDEFHELVVVDFHKKFGDHKLNIGILTIPFSGFKILEKSEHIFKNLLQQVKATKNIDILFLIGSVVETIDNYDDFSKRQIIAINSYGTFEFFDELIDCLWRKENLDLFQFPDSIHGINFYEQRNNKNNLKDAIDKCEQKRPIEYVRSDLFTLTSSFRRSSPFGRSHEDETETDHHRDNPFEKSVPLPRIVVEDGDDLPSKRKTVIFALESDETSIRSSSPEPRRLFAVDGRDGDISRSPSPSVPLKSALKQFVRNDETTSSKPSIFDDVRIHETRDVIGARSRPHTPASQLFEKSFVSSLSSPTLRKRSSVSSLFSSEQHQTTESSTLVGIFGSDTRPSASSLSSVSSSESTVYLPRSKSTPAQINHVTPTLERPRSRISEHFSSEPLKPIAPKSSKTPEIVGLFSTKETIGSSVLSSEQHQTTESSRSIQYTTYTKLSDALYDKKLSPTFENILKLKTIQQTEDLNGQEFELLASKLSQNGKFLELLYGYYMNGFLEDTVALMKNLRRVTNPEEKRGSLVFVVGNSLSDLSTIASIFALSYLYENTKSHSNHLDQIHGNYYVIPVIDYDFANEFSSKIEVMAIFQKFHIDLRNIIFLDELNDNTLENAHFILVNHDRPHPRIKESKVIQIILPKNDYSIPKSDIETISMASAKLTPTIVSELIFKSNYSNEYRFRECLNMLLYAILLDTCNITTKNALASSLDLHTIAHVQSLLPLEANAHDRYKLYQSIHEKKFDIDQYSWKPAHLLYRDFEIVRNLAGHIKVPVARIPMPIDTFLDHPDAQNELIKFAQSTNSVAVVVFGRYEDRINYKNDRGFAVYPNGVNNIAISNRIGKLITNDSKNAHFDIEHTSKMRSLHGLWYRQRNEDGFTIAVRKLIMVPIRNFVENLTDE